MLSFLVSMGLLAIDLAISLHRAYYDFASPFISCYPMGLQADSLAVPTHFFINLLLRASLAHFSRLYLFWALLANIPAVPAHFTTFLGLPQSIYFFFTFFTPMRFLLNSFGFLDLIITFLPLITFRAYWRLSQPNEFVNSFPGLPQPIYFLFTSYYSLRFTTSFLGLPRPIYLFLTSFYFCGHASHQSFHFILLGLFLGLLFENSLWSWTSMVALISLCLRQFVYLFLYVCAVARTHFFASVAICMLVSWHLCFLW